MLARVTPLLANPDRMRSIGHAALDVLRAEPRTDPDRIAALMQAAGVDWRLVIYGGALHAFHHPPTRADQTVLASVGYHPRHAQRAWRDIVALLAECLPLSE
ncbi:MAG: dienelactone hydrolase family protein [Sciscionella sp.]